MKTRQSTAAVLFAMFAASTAFAQEGTQDFADQALSTRSRAEVRAELAQARAAGQLENRDESYGGFDRSAIASTKSRAEVRAELDEARRAGTLDTRNESYGGLDRTAVASTKTRAEVRAELARAQASHVHLSRGERSGS
jgi:hypothetical protein